jgi:hypothetical protein
MLVDMNAVTQCMVVSSPLCSGRLPIIVLHRNESKLPLICTSFLCPVSGNVSSTTEE